MSPREAPPVAIDQPASSVAAVTDLLLAWGQGHDTALEQLVPIVHRELRRIARRQMRRERESHTLQTTALVNEAYLRLVDLSRVKWQDRAHFFAMSARLMRRILVDHARSRKYQKRGGGMTPLQLSPATDLALERHTDFVALDDALVTLATQDPRKAQVVELRFFGGFSVAETGQILGVSPETVARDWRFAKAWLHRELNRDA